MAPPTRAVLPSADSATPAPNSASPMAKAPASCACWVHVPELLVKTYAAPALPPARAPPTRMVLPLAESATPVPKSPKPCEGTPAPVRMATSVHVPPLRTRTSSAGTTLPTIPPARTTVLPSADTTGLVPPAAPLGKALMFSLSQPLSPVVPRVNVHADELPFQ